MDLVDCCMSMFELVFYDLEFVVGFDVFVDFVEVILLCVDMIYVNCDYFVMIILLMFVQVVGCVVVWEDWVIFGFVGVLDFEIIVVCLVQVFLDLVLVVLLIYGGGMVFGMCFFGIVEFIDFVEWYGVVGVVVEYCFVFEYFGLVQVEDCYVVLEWMVIYVDEFGIDIVCIIVFGQSVGGGFLVVVVLFFCDCGGLWLVGQFFGCLMFDDCNEIFLSCQYDGFGVWDWNNNDMVWDVIVGVDWFIDCVLLYMVLVWVVDLLGFVLVFIEVGVVEIFCDEVVDYVLWIWVMGGQVELYVWVGGYYGFLGFFFDVEVFWVVVVVWESWLCCVLCFEG